MRHTRESEYTPEFSSLTAYREQQNFLKDCKKTAQRKRCPKWSSLSAEEQLNCKLNSATSDVFAQSKLQAIEKMESGDWTDTHPIVFIAVFSIWHEREYGFIDSELEVVRQRKYFISVISNVIRVQFDNNTNDYAEFVRWTFERYAQKSKWMASKHLEIKRLNAYALTNLSAINDFKLACTRE